MKFKVLLAACAAIIISGPMWAQEQSDPSPREDPQQVQAASAEEPCLVWGQHTAHEATALPGHTQRPCGGVWDPPMWQHRMFYSQAEKKDKLKR